MKKPDSTKPIHAQGIHPDKGRCGRRGMRTRDLDKVTCTECRPTLPGGATRSTAVAAMHKIAGA